MSADLASPLRSVAAFLEQTPEWWILPLSAAAWAAMMPHALADGVSCHQLSFTADWWAWCLMVVAMMLPVMHQSVRWVAERSFRYRQGRAMLGYVLGYLLPWVVLGGGMAWLLGASWIRASWSPAAAFGLAAIWSMTPMHAWFMGKSHAVIPLVPTGWRADRDTVLLGVRQGLPCMGACWLVMLGCTLTGHGLVAMVGGAAIGMVERLYWRSRPWMVTAGCLGLAGWYGGALLLG